MLHPNELSRAELEETVTEIRNLLYLWETGEEVQVLDCRKVWYPETVDAIEDVFKKHDLYPTETVVLQRIHA